MKRETIRKLVAASILACAASASQAAVVDIWNFDINMAWTDAVFSNEKDPLSLQRFDPVKDPTTISWGYRYGVDGVVTDQSAGLLIASTYSRSSLIITEPHGSGAIRTDDSVLMVNMFEHTNNPIAPSYDDLLQATLSVSVDLSANGTTVKTFNDDFKVYFYETPNENKSGTGSNGCSWGSNCNDDLFAFVVIPEIYREFTYDGITYRFEYFQTSGPDAIQQFSAAVCSDISRGVVTTSCYGFRTPEFGKTPLQFGISISAPAVPEPGTYAMLLAGLGVIGVVVRRRRHTIHN